jgi:hypothetical protein
MEITFKPTSSTNRYPLIFTRTETVYDSKIQSMIIGATITGVYPGHNWEKGDIIDCSHPMCLGSFVVSEVIEQRDAKGIYENNEGKNSFFHLKLSQYIPE